MKIEKINDNQIKCTLSSADLADHQLKLSELAFGSDKAKALFRDVMEEANERFDFEPNENPLMVEAIPVNSDSIVLLITKVTHPDEIDQRMEGVGDDDIDTFLPKELEQNVRHALKHVHDAIVKESSAKAEAQKKPEYPDFSIFDFGTLDDVIAVSHLIDVLHVPNSALYYSDRDALYYLVLHYDGIDSSFIPSVISTLNEFGSECQSLPAIESYFKEHCRIVIAQNAIEKLACVPLG